MNDQNKKIIQLNLKIKRTNPSTEKQNSLLKLVKNRRTESLPNLSNINYKENDQNLYNQQNISSNHIREIHIDLKNIPKETFDKCIPTKNYSQNNSLPFRNKINISFSQESSISPKVDKTVTITSDTLPYISNNTYTPPLIEMYKAEMGKIKENKIIYKNREREKQSYSMDNTYSKDKTYLNKNDNYNQTNILKKLENNDYSTYNNSLIMNRTNIEDDSKLNNTINYIQDKYYYQKNSLTNIKNIPKPKKFKKKILPIPTRKTVGFNSINNSYFDEINNNNNYNTNNNNNVTLPKPKIRYSYLQNENNNNTKKNINYKIIHKKSITECKNNIYLNKTHSPNYLKDMEEMGIRLSFNKRRRNNESIDLISSELLKDLKRHSFNKKREIIFSDLDEDKVKKNKYSTICNNIPNDSRKDIYNEMQKKRIQRLSSYLLKNKKNKWVKNNSVRKEKYDIIDIKEKIKKERRNRTISNSSKFRKKEIVKDKPTATLIRKEDEKGGKVDFIIPSKNTRNKNKNYNIRVGLRKNNNSCNLIINKNEISINAAKTIQKWWRNLLSEFITEFNIINIQSVFRGYIFRKKFNNISIKIPMDKYRKRENIKKIILIQKIWREYHISLKKKRKSYIFSSIKNKKKFIYRKSFKQKQNKTNNNIFENSNNNSYINNNNFIQQNSSFGIVSHKRKESINNQNENENENENNIDNDLIKNDLNDDKRNSEFLSLTQIKNDIIEIKGIDDSHIDDDELYKCLKSDYTTDKANKIKTDNKKYNIVEPVQIKGKNNLKLCLFTKKCYKNKGEESIILIQKYFRKYLKDKNRSKDKNLYLENKEEKIVVIPISLFPCFIEKIRIKKQDMNNNNPFSNSFKCNFTINNGCNINYSPINKSTDNKYDENQIKISNEKQIEITRTIVKENIEISNFEINIKNEKNKNNKLDIQKVQNSSEINYSHDIEISIKKECIEDIEKIPFVQKCYFSKKNIILIKASPIEYSISKINSEQYNPSSKKNTAYEISNIYSNEFLGKQKTKPEFLISQSINDNYITSSLNNKNKDNDENKTKKDNNYLISYSFSEFKATKKDQNLYEICTINTNIINSQSKLNDKYKILEIDNQNNTLNYNITKTESILKMPIQIGHYFTKENIVIDNYYKSKERNTLKLINKKSEISKDDINKEDKSDKKEILIYPNNNINCYISKNYISDKTKRIILIQKKIKKMINQRKIKTENSFMRQIMSNNLITKVFKDDSLEKIILIQRYFKKYKNLEKVDNKQSESKSINNKDLNNDIKNITNTNSKNCIDNTDNNQDNNIISEVMINENNITNKNNTNNNEDRKEICCNQKNLISDIKVKDNDYKKNIPYKKDSDKILSLKDKIKIENRYNYNEIANEQNNISYKNNKDDSDTCIYSFQKNSHTFENITTSYGTNDNFNFINKSKSSYNMVEKSENTFEQKTVVNIQENKNSYESSYKIIKYNKTEYENTEIKRKEENQRYNEINNYTQTAYQINVNKEENKEEEKINILKNKVKNYYIRIILNKIRKKIDYKKMVYVVQMLFQRINKNLNQYAFQRIKIFNNKNKTQTINSDREFIQKSFFFNAIKRHLKINKIDNKLESNNEVVILLRKNIPYFFMNNHKKNFIPYINQKQEKNLINSDIFLFDDDKLANYIYKCYKIEKNLFTITSHIIKNRLIKNPLKYQNLFSITRYMDNLYDDITNGNICQKCYCKSNELCLIGCHCHDNNFMMKNNINVLYRHSCANVSNIYNLKKKKEKEKKQNKKFEILKRFSESNIPTESDISIISNTNEMNYYNYYNNHTFNYTTYNTNTNTNNENIDKSNLQHEIRGSKKIHNFIKNFTLRKKIRNSISSNVSNISDEIEDKKMLRYNTNTNNLKEKSINHLNQIIDNAQSNNYEEDIKVDKSEGIKKINKSLYKKKINKIIPMSKSNRNSNIISKLNEFRTRQSESRKKNKEIIKLRDDFYYDNEIYENI